jgi:hypothetical protein
MPRGSLTASEPGAVALGRNRAKGATGFLPCDINSAHSARTLLPSRAGRVAHRGRRLRNASLRHRTGAPLPLHRRPPRSPRPRPSASVYLIGAGSQRKAGPTAPATRLPTISTPGTSSCATNPQAAPGSGTVTRRPKPPLRWSSAKWCLRRLRNRRGQGLVDAQSQHRLRRKRLQPRLVSLPRLGRGAAQQRAERQI